MIRDFHGYRQHFVTYTMFSARTQSYIDVKRWVFYVTGFCFDNVSCHVLKTDGSEDQVPIDRDNRILIKGKWFEQEFWEH